MESAPTDFVFIFYLLSFTFMALTDENNISRSFINQDIGKTVFLTEEEAEKALEGINHD